MDFVKVDWRSSLRFSPEFNSRQHLPSEVPNEIEPSTAPYSVKRWLPFIMELRGHNREDAVQHINLHIPEGERHECYRALLWRRRPNWQAMAYGLKDNIDAMMQIVRMPPEGLEVRFMNQSNEDGKQRLPRKIIRDTRDLQGLLVRGDSSFQRAASRVVSIHHGAVPLFFAPFEKSIKTARMYRVFCNPIELRITAISQYQWHSKWLFAKKRKSVRMDAANRIVEGAQRLKDEIVHELNFRSSLDMLVLTQGFTFDFCYDETSQDIILDEINSFGALGKTGACLFHWIEDHDLLYGHNGSDEPVEFRVTY